MKNFCATKFLKSEFCDMYFVSESHGQQKCGAAVATLSQNY